MKNLLVLYWILLTACGTVKLEKLSTGEVIEKDDIAEIKEVETKSIEKDLELLEVKSFKGFTQSEVGRFWQYSKLVDDITHSKCFADYLTNYKQLINNKLETVDNLILTLRSQKPKLNFVMYYSPKSTVGYTYENSDTIWFNRKFHGNFSLLESAANLAHERSHKLGYTHDFKNTARRKHQVPYTVGEGMKACADSVGYEKQKVKACYRSWKSLWLKNYCYWKGK